MSTIETDFENEAGSVTDTLLKKRKQDPRVEINRRRMHEAREGGAPAGIGESDTSGGVRTFMEIPLDKIHDNPNQPRLTYNKESLLELSLSMKGGATEKNKYAGLITPIEVVRKGDEYIIVAGHRRVRAARLAKWTRIPAIVNGENMEPKKLRRRAIIENIHREDMDPVETGFAIKEALENGEYDDQKAVADALGKDKSFVTKVLKILSLPEAVLHDIMANRTITDTEVIYILRRVEDPEKCTSIYEWYISQEQRPNREELKRHIAASLEGGERTAPGYRIKTTKKGHTVSLPKLDEKKIKKLESFIAKLIGE